MCVDKFFESDRLASIHLICFEPVFVARHTKKSLACVLILLFKMRALFVVLHIIIRGRLCIFTQTCLILVSKLCAYYLTNIVSI